MRWLACLALQELASPRCSTSWQSARPVAGSQALCTAMAAASVQTSSDAVPMCLRLVATVWSLSHICSCTVLHASGQQLCKCWADSAKTALETDATICLQEDVFVPTLCALETVQFAAQLRLPGAATPGYRSTRVKQVMKVMGLWRSRNTQVGPPSCSGRCCTAQHLTLMPTGMTALRHRLSAGHIRRSVTEHASVHADAQQPRAVPHSQPADSRLPPASKPAC